ncbi:MAG TPA: hypothetical protein VF103_19295, partial [Polyangiaceae bacterium]
MPHRALPTLAVIACFACRIEPTPGAPLGPPDGAEEPGSVTTPDESTGGFGGNASTARGGGSGRPPATGGAGAGGEEDEPSSGACDATAVTLDEVRSGAVLSSVTVALVATATSQKFLVSETDAGNCLWGAFLGDEPTSDEPRGVAVVSYGNPAPGDARCEPGTDAIPDELAPGDVVRAVGRASSFVPSSCGGTPAIVQLMAEARCPFERLRRTTPPEPVQLPLDVANGIARGDDPSLTRRWAGG